MSFRRRAEIVPTSGGKPGVACSCCNRRGARLIYTDAGADTALLLSYRRAAVMYKANFLGPKGENADELERLLLEVLRDHVFWRRNFHPGDDRLIGERDKQSEAYAQSVARLRDELFEILAELKRGAPLYSPRQIAHVVSDPTLPALIGYFAGLLYNQNNVVAEVAPETVRKEHGYMDALARMIDYPPILPERLPSGARRDRTPFAWGHLCSGGTVANLEALWIARNVRLYPLAVRLLAATDPRFSYLAEWEVTPAGGAPQPLGSLRTFEALNLPIQETTDLHLRIREALREDEAHARAFDEAVPSVRKAGLATFLMHYNDAFPNDRFRPPVVLVSQAGHYCWDKNMDVIGLGAQALEHVPVDDRVRLNVDALEEAVRAHAAEERAVLMAVSICGTTEEGAIDPMHRIEALRTELTADGLTLWHHCDAALGGYFTSMLPRDADGHVLPFDTAREAVWALAGKDKLIDEEIYRALAAVNQANSVTIDPHKFGYIPYPAGAILVRDYHLRDAISYAAPYLATDDRAGFSGFLGQWTLEGSRPGAAAVSSYLSQAALPLTADGHGQLMQNCIAANKRIVDVLTARFAQDDGLTLYPFAEPDTVGFCFVIVPEGGVRSIDELNTFNRQIWQRVSTASEADNVNQYDFLLSKTAVDVPAYAHLLSGMVPEAVLDEAVEDRTSLLLLRIFVMNPFLKEWNEQTPSFAEAFSDHVYNVAAAVYPEHVLRLRKRDHDGERLGVLVLEAPGPGEASLAEHLENSPRYAAFVDVHRAALPQAGEGLPAVPRSIHKVVVVLRPGQQQRGTATLQALTAAAVDAQDTVVVARAQLLQHLEEAAPDALSGPQVVEATNLEDMLQAVMQRVSRRTDEALPVAS